MNEIAKTIKELNKKFYLKPDRFTIIVKISRQMLYLLSGFKIIKRYPVSTSRYGIGNKAGSYKTPVGTHRICSKIGRNAKSGTIFLNRKNTGRISKIYKNYLANPDDVITTRILRLKGLERGVNKGKGIDSFMRQIYIHGTPSEFIIGRAASHGCIRMKNKDIIELFNLVRRNTIVEIQK